MAEPYGVEYGCDNRQTHNGSTEHFPHDDYPRYYAITGYRHVTSVDNLRMIAVLRRDFNHRGRLEPHGRLMLNCDFGSPPSCVFQTEV